MKNILGRLRFTVIIGIFILAVLAILIASAIEINSTYDSVLQIDEHANQQVESIEAARLYDNTSRDLNRKCWQYQAYKDPGFLDSYIEEAFVTKSKEEALEEILSLDNSEEEKEYIQEVAKSSDVVLATELYAMRILADGLNVDPETLPNELLAVQLSEEDEKLSDADKIEKSYAMVNTKEYDSAIQGITNGLENYSVAKAQEYTSSSNKYVADVLQNAAVEKFYLILSGVLLIISAITVYISIVRPMNGYLLDISEGGVDLNECTPRGTKEFRNFAAAYNEAVSKYHRQTEKLKQEIEIRHLLEKSSETITIIFDEETQLANISDDSCMLMDEVETNLTREQLLELIRTRVYEDDVEMMTMRKGYSLEGSRDFRVYNKEGEIVWYNSWYMFVMEEDEPALLIATVRNIDERVKRTMKLEKMAQTDLKTGLLNSVSTTARINDFLKGEGIASFHSLLIVDIDNFKSVNDTLGHQAGDETLVKIARILEENFRTNDIVGRLGGDEFIVLVKDVLDEKTLELKMSAVLENLQFTVTGDSGKMEITASIGHANYQNDNKTFDDLYKEADKNLYQAKERGKNQAV